MTTNEYKRLRAGVEMMRVCIWVCDVQHSPNGALLVDMIPEGKQAHRMWRSVAREMIQKGLFEATTGDAKIYTRYRYTEAGYRWYAGAIDRLRRYEFLQKKYLTSTPQKVTL